MNSIKLGINNIYCLISINILFLLSICFFFINKQIYKVLLTHLFSQLSQFVFKKKYGRNLKFFDILLFREGKKIIMDCWDI